MEMKDREFLESRGWTENTDRVGPWRTRTASRAKMIRELDAIARQEVFERDGGVCIHCSNRDRAVQWAHVLSRRHLCVRWLPDNAMTLCAGCHLFWHHEPAMALDWFFKNYRERWNRLQLVFMAGVKVDVRSLWVERVQGGTK